MQVSVYYTIHEWQADALMDFCQYLQFAKVSIDLTMEKCRDG